MTLIKENGPSRLRRDPARRARSCFLAVTLLASLSTNAFAAEVAVPVKSPAAILTVPDTWTTKDIDDGIQAMPPDKAVAVYVNHGARSDLETTLRTYREWMKKQKIVVNTPKESTMDFAGTPGRVIRYDTKTKSGDKTIVDFIVLNASRERFIIVTLWGSTEEREGNEAALAAIMASLKIPADTGSFWSGNSAAKPTDDRAKIEEKTKTEDKIKTATATAPPAAAPPAAPSVPAVVGPSEDRVASYLYGLIIQSAIQRCDISTTSRQRDAIDRKLTGLRVEMAPVEAEVQAALQAQLKQTPNCPPPEREAVFRESIALFIDKSPDEFAGAMERAHAAHDAAAAKTASAAPPAGSTSAKAADTKPTQPYGVRKALFVTRAARYFDDVEARPTNIFKTGEILFSYLEPAGQSAQPAANGEKQAGVLVDMEIRTASGEVLAGKKGMFDRQIAVGQDQTLDTLYLNTDVTLTNVQPGTYTLVYILKDKLNGRTAEVPQPFTIVSSSADAAPPAATP